MSRPPIQGPAGLKHVVAAPRKCHHGWVMLLACASCYAASASAHSFSYAPFVDAWMKELAISRSMISSFWTCAMIVSAFSMPFAGSLIDRKGARRVLLGCAPVAACVALWLGMLSTPVELCLAITINRVASADMLTLLSQTTLNRWFIRHRGRAALVLGVVMAWLLEFPAMEMQFQSFAGGRRGAYVMIFAYVALLSIISIALWGDTPESVGLLPDLRYPELSEEGEVGLPLKLPSTVNSPKADTAGEVCFTRAQAAQTLLFWAVNLAQFNGSLLWVACHLHLVDILALRGLPSVMVPAFYNTVSVGRLIMTMLLSIFVVDRLGRRSYLLLAAATGPQLAVCLLLLGLIGPETWPDWMAIVFGLVYGFWGGINSCVSNIVFAQIFGREHVGAISGLAKGVNLMAGGLGPLLFSVVKEVSGSYDIALRCMLVSSVASGIILCIAPMPGHTFSQPQPITVSAVNLGRNEAYRKVSKAAGSESVAEEYAQ